MTSIEREEAEAIARKAKVIRDIWLSEKEAVQAVQVSANAEVRRGWSESDNLRKVKSGKMPQSFRRRG